MNIYKELNKIIEYIENHLEEKIDYKEISKMIGVNEYTFQKIFSVMCNVSISEYIRNRRLSNAGQELYINDEKVIDIAIRYQYDNPTSFSRAFEKFHGIKPSQVRKNPEKLKMYTKLHFNENYECNKNVDYKIVKIEKMVLYGKYINIYLDNEKAKKEAPEFYYKLQKQYGEPQYGMVEYYEKDRIHVKRYWIMYNRNIEGLEQKIIPESKWIQIRVNSQEAKDIQQISDTFYEDFLPSCKYNLRELPDIEYYHDGITDFLVPIED